MWLSVAAGPRPWAGREVWILEVAVAIVLGWGRAFVGEEGSVDWMICKDSDMEKRWDVIVLVRAGQVRMEAGKSDLRMRKVPMFGIQDITSFEA
jgi:hypothetical protein